MQKKKKTLCWEPAIKIAKLYIIFLVYYCYKKCTYKEQNSVN